MPSPASRPQMSLIEAVQALLEVWDETPPTTFTRSLTDPAWPAVTALRLALTAEGMRLARAMERDALAAALVDMSPDRFAHWAANGTTYPNSYQSEIDRAYRLADRIRSALTQPEHPPHAD